MHVTIFFLGCIYVLNKYNVANQSIFSYLCTKDKCYYITNPQVEGSVKDEKKITNLINNSGKLSTVYF